jgi:ketosteroid isomerase-like protein
MAEHPDITLVKRGYAAFASADIPTLSELLAPDAVQHMPGSNQISGDYKSRDEILAFYGRLAELTDGTYGVEPESFFTDGNGTVTVVHRLRGQRNGKQLAGRDALIFRVEGGQLVELTDLSDDLDAGNAFWS